MLDLILFKTHYAVVYSESGQDGPASGTVPVSNNRNSICPAPIILFVISPTFHMSLYFYTLSI